MAHTFDLVGAHPRIEAEANGAFYEELVLRIATVMSTTEITEHEVVEAPISQQVWRRLSAPRAMIACMESRVGKLLTSGLLGK